MRQLNIQKKIIINFRFVSAVTRQQVAHISVILSKFCIKKCVIPCGGVMYGVQYGLLIMFFFIFALYLSNVGLLLPQTNPETLF